MTQDLDLSLFGESGHKFINSTYSFYRNYLRFMVYLPVETSVIQDIEQMKKCWDETTEYEKLIMRNISFHSSGVTYTPPSSITWYKYQPEYEDNKGYLNLSLERRVEALQNVYGLYYIVWRMIHES
jgi:hypothetical protein